MDSFSNSASVLNVVRKKLSRCSSICPVLMDEAGRGIQGCRRRL
ncbi:hypothetical protein DCAR_0831001 [Daucus carota subsp. sativus]|uniref:Uncharacterized protein n=1 Tax=Daucus carota subsp. sativus TaxID=79200 RepID=A0AAF0XR92_DAUCS|nr:hypothetical protein DCAR_0831001 [Daucus carota subsp. sativus]